MASWQLEVFVPKVRSCCRVVENYGKLSLGIVDEEISHQ